MRMLVHASFPIEPFNSAVRDGSAGKKIQKIMEELKPEAAYFGEFDGRRSAMLFVNVADPSKIPTFAEPFFLYFNAEVKFRAVMTAEDLAKAGLDALGKKWG
jgi:hypothetical protein